MRGLSGGAVARHTLTSTSCPTVSLPHLNRFDDEADHKKKQVAEQRRKWRVKFYTQSGKPDKKRVIGRPWNSDVLAGPDRDVFCAGEISFASFPLLGLAGALKSLLTSSLFRQERSTCSPSKRKRWLAKRGPMQVSNRP